MSILNLRKPVRRTGFPVLAMIVVSIMAAGLSGCGVKSSPATVEDATYPRIYPAPAQEEFNRAPVTGSSNTGGTGYTRRSSTRDADGVYTPPPSALQPRAR
ncbi:MAG: hypothetical protein RH946_20990 [Rhodospirillales bacterium]